MTALRRVRDRAPGVLLGGRSPTSWFEVREIDARTYAITEPRYWQRNWNYLLLGSQRALLFDSGSGLADISPVVGALTDLPVTALASHLHWDHIGSHHRFARVAANRASPGRTGPPVGLAPDRRTTLTPRRRLVEVSEWIEPGSVIELGDRTLSVHSCAGHTADSIALHDPASGHLFCGDFLYDGPITFGLLPGSDLTAAHRSAAQLSRLGNVRTVFGGHYGPLDGTRLPALRDALAEILDSTVLSRGRPVRSGTVNGFRIVLTSSHARRHTRAWGSTAPEDAPPHPTP